MVAEIFQYENILKEDLPCGNGKRIKKRRQSSSSFMEQWNITAAMVGSLKCGVGIGLSCRHGGLTRPRNDFKKS